MSAQKKPPFEKDEWITQGPLLMLHQRTYMRAGSVMEEAASYESGFRVGPLDATYYRVATAEELEAEVVKLQRRADELAAAAENMRSSTRRDVETGDPTLDAIFRSGVNQTKLSDVRAASSVRDVRSSLRYGAVATGTDESPDGGVHVEDKRPMKKVQPRGVKPTASGRQVSGPGLECQLFTWTRWDQADTDTFLFMGCTTVTQVGPFTPGTQLDSVALDYSKSGIVVYAEDGSERWRGELRLSVAGF